MAQERDGVHEIWDNIGQFRHIVTNPTLGGSLESTSTVQHPRWV